MKSLIACDFLNSVLFWKWNNFSSCWKIQFDSTFCNYCCWLSFWFLECVWLVVLNCLTELLKIIRSSVEAWKPWCLFKTSYCLPNNSSLVYTFEKPVNLCTVWLFIIWSSIWLKEWELWHALLVMPLLLVIWFTMDCTHSFCISHLPSLPSHIA